MVEVAPLPPDVLMLLRALLGSLRSPLAPLLPTRDARVGLLELLLGLSVVARIVYDVAVRRDEKHLEAHVYASLPSGERGSGSVGTSAHEYETYQPSASLEMVTVLIVPWIGRDQRTAMRPILLKTR
jgi:hypothetical protein